MCMMYAGWKCPDEIHGFVPLVSSLGMMSWTTEMQCQGGRTRFIGCWAASETQRALSYTVAFPHPAVGSFLHTHLANKTKTTKTTKKSTSVKCVLTYGVTSIQLQSGILVCPQLVLQTSFSQNIRLPSFMSWWSLNLSIVVKSSIKT